MSSSLHHLATGAWVVSAAAVHLMNRRIVGMTGDAQAQLVEQAFVVFEVMVISLIVIFASGVGTYFLSRGQAEQTRTSGGLFGLVGRHVAYVAASIVGSWWTFVLFLP